MKSAECLLPNFSQITSIKAQSLDLVRVSFQIQSGACQRTKDKKKHIIVPVFLNLTVLKCLISLLMNSVI